jgi:hypothetical protein
MPQDINPLGLPMQNAIPLDRCAQCRGLIETEPCRTGEFRYHVATGDFLCPEPPLLDLKGMLPDEQWTRWDK